VAATDGKVVWRVAIDGKLSTTPLILDGTMFFTTQRPTSGILSASTGSRASVGAVFNSSFKLLPFQPASPMLPHKAGLASVYAVHLSDGKIRWYSPLNDEKVAGSWLAVENGIVYTAFYGGGGMFGDGMIYALGSKDGTVGWSRISDIALSQGELANGIIYMTAYIDDSQSAVFAVRASDGTQLRRYPVSANSIFSMQATGSTLYVIADNGLRRSRA